LFVITAKKKKKLSRLLDLAALWSNCRVSTQFLVYTIPTVCSYKISIYLHGGSAHKWRYMLKHVHRIMINSNLPTWMCENAGKELFYRILVAFAKSTQPVPDHSHFCAPI